VVDQRGVKRDELTTPLEQFHPKERIFGHGAQASRPPPYQQRLKKSLVKPVAQFNFLSLL
jgi:hypothetical protein